MSMIWLLFINLLFVNISQHGSLSPLVGQVLLRKWGSSHVPNHQIWQHTQKKTKFPHCVTSGMGRIEPGATTFHKMFVQPCLWRPFDTENIKVEGSRELGWTMRKLRVLREEEEWTMYAGCLPIFTPKSLSTNITYRVFPNNVRSESYYFLVPWYECHWVLDPIVVSQDVVH